MTPDIPQVSDSLATNRQGWWRVFLTGLVLVCMATPVYAAATLTVQIEGGGYSGSGQAPQDGTQLNIGETVTIVLTVASGIVSQPVQLPHADGLVVNGSGTNPYGGSEKLNFFVTPARAGDITIPAFDIYTDDGQTLHVPVIKFHVVSQ